MRRWTLALLAAAAVAGLSGCDREPPNTEVQSAGPSLPDDTVLNAPQASAPPAADPNAAAVATPPAAEPAVAAAPSPAAAEPAVAAAPSPGTGEPVTAGPSGDVSAAAQEPAPPVTNAMGAQPAASATDATAAGVAAPTEMSRAQGSAGAASAPKPDKVSALPQVRDAGDGEGARLLAQQALQVPVTGIQPASLADNYTQSRGQRKHEAIDILAPAGTPVVAVDDGRVAKLFTSKPGGFTIYQFDREQRLAYYYAHLQGYAPGVREGMDVKRGEVIGYVGSTGNADAKTPHLHFAIFRLGTPPRWWEGEAVNPYPALSKAQPSSQVAAR